MSKPQDAGSAAFEEATEKLSKGLKTCRSVIDNYRQMLVAEEQPPSPPADKAPQ